MAGKPIKLNMDQLTPMAWDAYVRKLPEVKVMIEGHWDPCDCARCQGIRAQERITLEGQS